LKLRLWGFLEAVLRAVENVKDLVNEMPGIPKKEVKRRELAYKATVSLLKTAGLLPRPVQSVFIQNIFNPVQNIFDNPLLTKLIESMQEEESQMGSIAVDYEIADR